MNLTKDSYFLFSGGEVHLKLTKLPPEIIMTDYTMNGFMALAEYVDIVRRHSSSYMINITYPYFPYARQDRVMAGDEPFSLRVFCDLLNSLKLSQVTIWDPHSDVTPALINNCWVIPQWEIAKKCIPEEYFSSANSLFISPDAGAYKKLSKLIPDDRRIAIGVKHRDESGKISGTNVFSVPPIEGKDCIIVDDICDGGRTFIELAKVLKAKGAKKVILYVTHGIFSNGFLELDKYIDYIYTTNSFETEISNLVTRMEIA